MLSRIAIQIALNIIVKVYVPALFLLVASLPMLSSVMSDVDCTGTSTTLCSHDLRNNEAVSDFFDTVHLCAGLMFIPIFSFPISWIFTIFVLAPARLEMMAIHVVNANGEEKTAWDVISDITLIPAYLPAFYVASALGFVLVLCAFIYGCYRGRELDAMFTLPHEFAEDNPHYVWRRRMKAQRARDRERVEAFVARRAARAFALTPEGQIQQANSSNAYVASNQRANAVLRAALARDALARAAPEPTDD